uniref:MAK10-like protein n=1 Tax=Tanacetum cinerariifolium TaxID=118510 RepID=A0A699GV79_TANCI|nr:MAK10-like protein [Tanacetum cinerariifolium]
MAEMFRLLKELTTSRALEKVLIKEDAKSPVTKNINSTSLARGKKERNDNDYMAVDGGINETDTEIPVKESEKETEAEKGTKNKPIKKAEREEKTEASSSQPVGYYQKHRINEKLTKGFVNNHRFNESLSGIRVGKVKGKTYNLSPRGPVYEAILKKKITRKEDIGGNFEIPCNIGGLKHMNTLVDQGSDEGEKRPFILGTPILKTAKAVIKYEKGTITQSSRKRIKRRRRNLSGDGVKKTTTSSGRGRLNRGSRIIYVATALGLQSDAYEIDLYNESWEIIENLALYDHEGWNDSKEFVKPVKAISTPQSTSKTPDQRLLESEDQINFLLKGSRATSRPSSTHIPQAYAEAAKMGHQSRTPSVFITAPRKKERKDNEYMVADGSINETYMKIRVKEAEKDTEAENRTKNKPIKRAEASSSQPVGYYQKHRINKKLIKGLVDNHRFNDFLSRIQVGKVKGKTYNLLPKGPRNP